MYITEILRIRTPLQLLFLLFGMHRLTVTSDILDGVQALIEANMLLVDGLAEEEDNMHMFKATMLIASHLGGTFKADYLSILNEYTLKLLKKEPCDGGEGYPGGYEQVITLVAAYCGQLQLPSLWSKYCSHLPKDEGSTLEASVELLDDIVALTRIDSAGILGEQTLGYHTLKYQALEYAFRTGNITAANKILSAVFGHCLADFGLEFFGSDHGLQLWKIGLPPEVFRAGNKETLEIFERVGGKPANIRYMFMFHAMGYWSSDLQQQLMDEADSTVLSQLLRGFSDFRLFTPVKTLQFLISKGADVNYFDENCPPHTALAAAASHGSINSINILLEHGADILLGTEQGAISELFRLWCEKTGSTNWYTYDGMKGLIERLENIEREEREKRKVPNPPVTVTDTGLPLLNLPHTLRHY